MSVAESRAIARSADMSAMRRVLSLDGGGVKGMAILLVLKRLFRTIQRDEGLREMPRPCDYFDLIGGTSTGGLIAIMLGRLRMSIDDCIDVFQHISETVFGESPSTVSRIVSAVLGRPFFNAQNLEVAIKEVLTTRGFAEDAQLCEGQDSGCKVFVAATRAQTVHPVLLRSYKTWQASEENYKCYVWEAARATSAAPLFFEPTRLATNETFVDGALHLNNPITEVIREAESLWPSTTLKSIVSIGTGWIDPKGLDISQLRGHNVVKTCIDLALNSNNEAQKFIRGNEGKALADAGIYYRFDVDRGIDTVSLDQWQKLDDIDAFTQAYLARNGSEIERCARSLCEEDSAPNNSSVNTPEYISTIPQYSDTSKSNSIFSGRETELANVQIMMEDSPKSRQSVCLFGLGGIGKSQIAYEYARRCCTERCVFWVRANNLDNAASGFLAIAKKLIPQFKPTSKVETFEAVKRYLEATDIPPWLLVLDDADDMDLLIGSSQASDHFRLINYIPFAAHGRILITTTESRLVGLEDIVPAQNGIRVKEMTIDDGLCLLNKCLPSILAFTAPESRRLFFLGMLGGLPLAIVQATSYMREEQLPLEDFITLYKDIELHHELFKKSALSVDQAQKTVLLTWEISYKKIAGNLYPQSKSPPGMLLDLLGFLDAQSSPIMRSLTEGEYIFKDENGSTPIDGLENLFEQQESPIDILTNIYDKHVKTNHALPLQLAIGPLRNYSLITSRDCWVHPVVHSWISRRLPIEERYKYVTWLVEELLERLAMADQGPQDGWEAFMLGRTYRWLVHDELAPHRHAGIVIKHAFGTRMKRYMAAQRLSTQKFAELLYQVGRMNASAGKTNRAIKYIRDAITTMETDPTGCDHVLVAERRLQLAKVRSTIISPRDATSEARECSRGQDASAPAIVWLADCLRKEGHLQESLQLFRNIMEAFGLGNTINFNRDRETFAATIGAAFVLAAMGDDHSKAEARMIIDYTLTPFITSMPHEHMLTTALYPSILLCRVEVAGGTMDQDRALENMIHHDARCLDKSSIGGYPEIWWRNIEDLREKNKWSIIEVVGSKYIKSRHSVKEIVRVAWLAASEHPTASGQPRALKSDINHWCSIYNRVGRAYFESGRYSIAEELHWSAMGLWLSLDPGQIHSYQFRSNLWNLDQALFNQGGRSAESKRRLLTRYFENVLMEARINRSLR